MKGFGSGTGRWLWACARLALLLGLPLASQAASLQPLTEDEMSRVTGREGVLVSLEYYYNSDPIDDPLTPHFNEAGQALGGFCSSPNGNSSLGNMNCRLGLQLENRSGEWLVFKNGHASLVVNRLSLDASFLGDASASSVAYESFFDVRKFQDTDGSCLLETGNCSVSTLRKMPAMRAHYPQTGGAYNPATHRAEGYDDARFGLYFEGLAVEYNSAPGVQDGWMNNDNGSFLGLNIADNNGHQAGIAFGGNFYMYGF